MSGYYTNTSLDGPGDQASLALTTTPVLVKVGASPLAERKYVTIQPNQKDTYLGYTSGVTATTGVKLAKDQIVTISAAAALTVYLVMGTGTGTARIAEVE